MKKWVSSMVLAVAMGSSTVAYAQIDPLIEGAKMCTRHLTRYEREYGIPTHLLSAISTVESGRYHKGLQIRLPWPWAVNVEGQGYMFDSKAEAIAAVRKFRARGAKSIDVGCMQVNLVHHANAFSSLDKAFDPETNIAYAASFLRSLYEEENSWKKAAADYHSKTPGRGSEYAGQVYNSWFTIIDKLRAARVQTGDTQVVAANTQVQVVAVPDTAPVVEAKPVPRPVAAAAVKATEKQLASNYIAPHLRSVSVTSLPVHRRVSVRTAHVIPRDHDNDVLVINAQPVAANVPTPAVSPKTIMVAQDSESKIIHLDNDAPVVPVSTAAQPAAPNFIFRD